jgi:sec-independent protein translocase protein TatB
VLDLSPTKLIIIFVVVIVLLGPKRLPQIARQLGAGWRKIVGFQQQIERELHESMPDMPSSQDIVRFARSPVSMLHRLAEFPSAPAEAPVEDPAAPDPGDAAPMVASEAGPSTAAGTTGVGNGIAPFPEDPASAAFSAAHATPGTPSSAPPALAAAPAGAGAIPPEGSPGSPAGSPGSPEGSPGSPAAAPAVQQSGIVDLGSLVADDPTMN